VLHVRLTDVHAAHQNLPFPPNRTFLQSSINTRAGCDKYTSVPNFVEIARTAAETCEFQYYARLALKCLFTRLFGGFGGYEYGGGKYFKSK